MRRMPIPFFRSEKRRYEVAHGDDLLLDALKAIVASGLGRLGLDAIPERLVNSLS
jgi:hypothetical protein